MWKEFHSKPKGMRWRKYFRLRAESEELLLEALKTGLGRHRVELGHKRKD
jgi:hypothetical protein